MTPAALLGLLAGLAAALAFARVARKAAGRRASPPNRAALVALAAWWGGLGLSSLLHAARHALALGGVLTPEAAATQALVLALAASATAAGFVAYALHVAFGRRWTTPLAVALYVLAYVHEATRLAGTALGGVPDADPSAASRVLLALVPALAALAFAAAALRWGPPDARRRALLTTGVALAWGLAVLAPTAAPALLLGGAALALLAHRAPRHAPVP